MGTRKLSPELVKQIISDYDIKDMIRGLVDNTLQGILSAELGDHLGYEKYDKENKDTDNSRNHHSKKILRSEYGQIEIDIPRDRKGEFIPKAVAKHQADISGIVAQTISMYVNGMSNRDIEEHMRDLLYRVEVSSSLISRITNIILPEIRKIIYTTNIIESYHRQFRKVIKGKSIFPASEALLKMLYLVTQDVTRKWTIRIQNWGQILAQLTVFFPEGVRPLES